MNTKTVVSIVLHSYTYIKILSDNSPINESPNSTKYK